MQSRFLMPMNVVALALAALVSTGCSSTPATGDNNDNNNQNGNCTLTLSGGLTGSPTCSDVSATLTSNDNNTGIGINGADATDTVAVAISFSGAPTVTTYNNGNSSAVLLANDATGIWIGGGGSGTWSLAISSVKVLNSSDIFTSYEVHGMLTATIPSAVGSITSTVTVKATF